MASDGLCVRHVKPLSVAGPAMLVLPRLFFTHMALCIISAGYAATCLCIACMFLTCTLCDTYLLSHIACREFKYINPALSIHASIPALNPTGLLRVTAWHELMPNEIIG